MPFFFRNDVGVAVIVKGDRYRVMLNESLFTKIEEALSAAELMSFGHLGAGISHRWTVICGVSTNQRQLAL